MINSNGTEIDAAWRKEYEVAVDRCKNETFTLVYNFTSTNNSAGEKLEKVVEVPSQNPQAAAQASPMADASLQSLSASEGLGIFNCLLFHHMCSL